jgi:hypothetical protein
MIPVIDESVELWNKMWIADQVHDEMINRNVQAMQLKSESLLLKLQEDIDQLYDEPVRPVQKQVKKSSAAPMYMSTR